jgi:tetratricopeptide (TPR) repeat protein
VALGYFRTFFVPNHLSADTDRQALNSIFQGGAWVGFLFIAIVIAIALRTAKHREWRPVAFGLWWFLLALLPTGIFPLAEVENDHRMFFPFVGLVLAVCWPLGQWVFSRPPSRVFHLAAAGMCLVILSSAAWGTRQRNEVWRTEESLWFDVTLKSPGNGRGLMNYGLTLMAKGDYRGAHDYFTRAAGFTPDYHLLEINLGIVNGALNDDGAAERHFSRAAELAPAEVESHYFYARWLSQKGRRPEAVAKLKSAIALNPDYLAARYLMMEELAKAGNWGAVSDEAELTLRRFPSDATAVDYRSRALSNPAAPAPLTPEEYLTLSLSYHRVGQYQECIEAAQQALRLRPDSAEAYNNIAAAYEELEMWDAAIAAAEQALRIRPDFELARNNLLWSQEQKRRAQVLR